VADELSTVLAAIESLRSDVREDLAAERQSRKDIHERLGKLETTVAITGQVVAQQRDEIAAMKPTVSDWRDLLKTGKRISWAFSIAGITTVGGLVALITGAFDWIGGWLRSRGWM
jgi:hypothetical protein